MAETLSPFVQRQSLFFAEADARHFYWQTENPYFALTERELLRGVTLGAETTVLEVGCGEGGNLVNALKADRGIPRLVVGLDLFVRKLGFAKAQQLPAAFVCGTALSLPFRDGVFDVVLCRDVLHHLEDRSRAVAELRRVAKPGATVWIVEPNGRNPLIAFLALIRPHERGQLDTSLEALRRLVGPHFSHVEIEARQPLPLARMLLHYQYGWPRLGAARTFVALMRACDRTFATILPHRWWAYIVARARPEPPIP